MKLIRLPATIEWALSNVGEKLTLVRVWNSSVWLLVYTPVLGGFLGRIARMSSDHCGTGNGSPNQ